MQRTRRALLASLLTAVTVALGYSLAGVPNIELMTLTVFLSGYLLGAWLGAGVGGSSMTLHSIFNPLGAALPPLLAAQIVGFIAVGAAGGVLGPVIHRLRRRWLAFAACGTLGFLLTLFYDVLTNIGAFFVVTGENAPENLFAFVAAGILFMGMHIVWNTVIFFLTLTPLLNVFSTYRRELT